MGKDKKTVLFVDDEPNILSAMKRMLRARAGEWEMRFAGSGEEALASMAEVPADIIVSDIRMPGMDGYGLLKKVKTKYPDTIRIILSGYSSQEAAMQSLGVTHQYLSKPCEKEKLEATISRAFLIREMLKDEHLKRLLAGVKTLPSLPSLYSELLAELDSEEASIQGIADIVSRDASMTAKLLQLVNSSFFGLTRHVSNPAHAVALLGLDMIKALVLSVKVFSQFEKMFQPPGFSLDRLWRHSLLTGAVARRIAEYEGADRITLDNALAAGLLHDQGKLILAANLPAEYARSLRLSKLENIPEEQAERMELGASHALIGAYLLGLWGLPDALVEAVRFHHEPVHSLSKGISVLTVVHVADALDHSGLGEDIHSDALTGISNYKRQHEQTDGRVGENSGKDFPKPVSENPTEGLGNSNILLDREYLEREGLLDRLPVWMEIYREMSIMEHPI